MTGDSYELEKLDARLSDGRRGSGNWEDLRYVAGHYDDLINAVQPLQLADRIRGGLLTTDAIRALEPPPALIDGLLYLNTQALLYGPSGAAKTFLSTDWVQHVSFGAWWQRRPVTAGPVLYVVAEGVSGLGVRIDAWQTHHNLTREVHPVHWLPWAVNVSQPVWSSALAEVVGEIRPVLVVLDTFARCAVGAEENSARDVGMIVDGLDRIREAAGSCVLLVHHSGKDSAAGARGSSALRAAMHTELEMSGDPSHLVLKVTKQRDAPEVPPIRLALRSVEGTDSVVIDSIGDTDPDILPASTAATLAALADIDVPEGVPATAWKAASETTDRTFYRHRHGLIEHGLVVNVGTDKQPRYRPAEQVTTP